MILEKMKSEKNTFSSNENVRKNKELTLFIFKYFIQSKLGPILAFILPILYMTLYYATGTSNNDFSLFVQAIPAFVVFPILTLTLITIPQLIVELKNSIILRKIKTAGFTPLNFIMIVFSVFFVVTFVFTMLPIIYLFIFLNKDALELTKHINFGYLFLGIILTIIPSSFFGIFLGSLLKNATSSIFIGLSIFLATVSLSGQLAPLSVLASSDTLRYAYMILPINYSTSLINNAAAISTESAINSYFDPINAITDPIKLEDLSKTINIISKEDYFAGNNIFDFTSGFYLFSPGPENVEGFTTPFFNAILVFDGWQKALNLIMPFIIGIGLIFISIKKFSWYGR